MYHVSAQGVDERMINVHYYYYNYFHVNSFCCINFVVVDNITLMTQHGTLFFI